MKRKVLFICKNNSARSQIAEGILKTFFQDKYEVFSAGIQPTSINPYAVEVMREIGIDISNQYSKSINEFKKITFDFVIAVCDDAKENCSYHLGKKIIHKKFDDPSQINGKIEDILLKFRQTRDEIRNFIIEIF